MRKVLIVSVAILILAAFFLQQGLQIEPNEAFSTILRWPIEQRIALLAIGGAVLSVIGAGIWQSDKLAHQTRVIDALRRKIQGIRDDASLMEKNQGVADAAVSHLVGTDPVATVDDIQQRLASAEKHTSVQQGQDDAVDLQSRMDEIRRRQQALRTQLGSASDRRRGIEPVLAEVKDRQVLLERSLAALEKDDSGNSLDSRLGESESFLTQSQTRLDALEGMFVKLKQLKERSEQIQAEILPLESSESGIKFAFGEVVALRNQLDTALAELEKDENGTVKERMERLLKSKLEIEQRIAALTECFSSLEAIRRDIGGHFESLNATLKHHLKS